MQPEKLPTAVLVSELRSTESLTFTANAMAKLTADIHRNGLEHPVDFVVHGGVKYIVRGHHRRFAYELLGRQTIPAVQRELPYAGFRCAADLVCIERVSYRLYKVKQIRRRLRDMGIGTET